MAKQPKPKPGQKAKPGLGDVSRPPVVRTGGKPEHIRVKK